MPYNFLHIHNLDARYKISSRQTDAPSLQRRLDHIAKNLLVPAWEGCKAWANNDNDVIYFIKNMEVNLFLNPITKDDRTMANIWANALHEGILRTISQRGSNVIIFQNRSEYLASFISDIVRGSAWGKWYYREFEDLKLLSVGQVIQRILLADGDIGRDTLIELTRRGDLDLLLTILTDAEVETIVSQCLLPPGPRVILPNMVRAWVQALRSLISAHRIVLTSQIPREVARLYLHLLREHPELGPDVNLARFINDLLHLRQTIMQLRDQIHFLALVESENLTAALNQLGRGMGQQLLRTLVREIAGPEVAALLRDLQTQAPQPVIGRVSTSYGGIFMLVPAIVEMEIHNFLHRSPYPEPQGMSKTGLLLFVIALQCLGRKNVGQAQQDKGIALFAGLPSPLTGAQISQYSEALTPKMHKAFTEAFQAHQIKVKNRQGILKPSEQKNNSGWFSLYSEDNSFLINMEWDTALSTVSSAILMWFASKLGAFADSSPEYLCRNFLKCHAEIEVSPDRIAVYFLTCPLQMVLRMAGFDHTTWVVPWLENRKLEFHFE